jgi:hypothetical protein
MRETRANNTRAWTSRPIKVFASSINARTIDDSAGKVGCLPCATALAAKAGEP